MPNDVGEAVMVKSLVPEHIEGLVPYPPGKPLSELKRELGISDAIKLASNENALGPSPCAMDAIREALPEMHRYPDGGVFYLRRALSERLDVAPEQLVFGNGSNELIELLVRTFGGPQAGILTSQSTFVVYRLIAQAAGIPFEAAPMPRESLTFDLDAIAERVTAATRLIFLCNPNNPTGTMFPPAQLESFLERVGDEPIVVLDEAYIEYVRPDWRPNALSIVARRPRTVVLRTFSKAYGLAGVRIGYGITSAAIANYLERVRQPFNTNHLAQVGALAALDDNDHLERVLASTQEGMDLLVRGLSSLGLNPVPSHTNFVLFQVKCDGREVFDALLRKGVIVRPMHAYELPNHLRVNVGLPEENQRFLDALTQVVA